MEVPPLLVARAAFGTRKLRANSRRNERLAAPRFPDRGRPAVFSLRISLAALTLALGALPPAVRAQPVASPPPTAAAAASEAADATPAAATAVSSIAAPHDPNAAGPDI